MQRLLSVCLLALLLGSSVILFPFAVQETTAASDYRFTDLNGPTTATQGDTVTLEGTVVNVGNTSANKVVEFHVGDTVVDRQRVQLDGGERERITVEYTVPQDVKGTQYYGMTSRDNSLYESFTVQPDMMEMENETNDTMDMDKEEMMNNNGGNDNDGGSGTLDPQLAFLMIVVILLFVGGYVAYEVFTEP